MDEKDNLMADHIVPLLYYRGKNLSVNRLRNVFLEVHIVIYPL